MPNAGRLVVERRMPIMSRPWWFRCVATGMGLLRTSLKEDVFTS